MAAELLVRGLERARSLDLGFRTQGVTAISITLPLNTYHASQQTVFYDELTSKLGAPAAVARGFCK
jgi:hypothetical protein